MINTNITHKEIAETFGYGVRTIAEYKKSNTVRYEWLKAIAIFSKNKISANMIIGQEDRITILEDRIKELEDEKKEYKAIINQQSTEIAKLEKELNELINRFRNAGQSLAIEITKILNTEEK